MLEKIKVGVLGGGQLGAMLMRHAIDLGLDVSILDKDPDAPCSRYTSKFTVGDPKNFEDVLKFGEHLDVITIEIEAVNTQALKELSKKGIRVYPGPDTIETIQDKYLQKQFLEKHNIPVAPGIPVANREELRKYADKIPGCLKKRRDGYDGYGVMMLKSSADIEQAFDAPSVLEELVDIEQELAVIVARNEAGEIKSYDPVGMVFDKERFLLDYQVAPAEADKSVLAEARKLAEQIAEAIELKGILAVEMFLTGDGRIVVNEMAPRPHNSGHHTIEASATSQYEQLLRTMLEMPLGNTVLSSPSLMMNIIEDGCSPERRAERLKQLLAAEGVHLHWYGKKGLRVGRKIGHVTIMGSGSEQLSERAKLVREIING